MIQALMLDRDLEFLAKLAASHTKILEIGSYLGGSTRAMADKTEGFVLACDNWEGPRDIILTWKERQEIYGKFITNMGEHITTGRVVPWKANHASLDFSLAPKPPKYDMVFIDGSHVREDVMRDIATALLVIEPGGMICGHDYDLGFPGVVMALNEMLQGFSLEPNTRVWWKVAE